MRELKQHPDLGGDTLNASLLNEAYETLSDPARRAEYDEKMHVRKFGRNKPESGNDHGTQFSAQQCPFCKTSLTLHDLARGCCPTCKIPLPQSNKTDSDKTNRRTLARIPKQGRISYSSSWPGGFKEGMMIDLSLKGVRFLCSEKLQPGTILKIASAELIACGLVTNLHIQDASDKMPYAVGVSFLSIKFEETKGSFISLSG
jgi:hypothetical protein